MTLSKGEEPVPGYRLVGRLGEGAAGEVWQATGPGRTNAALKFLSLSEKNGVKEYRALQRVKEIRHANLLPIHAIWMLDEQGNVVDDVAAEDLETSPTPKRNVAATMFMQTGRPATLVVAMPLGDKNLLDRLHEFQKMGAEGIPTRELLDVMEDAARGIDYLNSPRHDLGSGLVAIQHRDIKPQNILLVGDSAAVCDFGLARDLGATHVSTAMAGTPAYIAPECIVGLKPSHATDQYSLAISYHELRTGELPFDNTSFVGVMEAHKTGNLNLSRLTPGEQKVILRATSVEPDDRFETTLAMVRALRGAVEGAAPVITKSEPPKAPQARPLTQSPKQTPAPKSTPQKAAPPGEINPAMLQTMMDPAMEIERMRRASISASAQKKNPAPPLEQVFSDPQSPKEEKPPEDRSAAKKEIPKTSVPPPVAGKRPVQKKKPNSPLKKGATAGSSSSAVTKPPQNTAGQESSGTPIAEIELSQRAPKPAPKQSTTRESVAGDRWEPAAPGIGNRNSQAASLLWFVVGIAIVVGLILLLL